MRIASRRAPIPATAAATVLFWMALADSPSNSSSTVGVWSSAERTPSETERRWPTFTTPLDDAVASATETEPDDSERGPAKESVSCFAPSSASVSSFV